MTPVLHGTLALTQAVGWKAAWAAGLTVGTYGQIERGRVNPTWTTFKSIARALGVTPAGLAALAERVGEPAAT